MTGAELYRIVSAWKEYRDECKANGLPVLWPNPLKQAEQVEIKKQKRRTKAEMQASGKDQNATQI